MDGDRKNNWSELKIAEYDKVKCKIEHICKEDELKRELGNVGSLEGKADSKL